jgi:hypothetical protein
MVQPSSTIHGINYQQVTTSGSGSPAQQAYHEHQAKATAQNNANQLSGGAIALPPMQSGTSPAQVALNAKVQSTGAQTATNGMYDDTVDKTTTSPTKGGRRRSRTNKRKTIKNKRKTRRNHKKSKKRRTKSSRK